LRWKGFFKMAKAVIPEAVHRRRGLILLLDAAVDGLQEITGECNSMPTSYPQAW